jgi:hypothetical protein
LNSAKPPVDVSVKYPAPTPADGNTQALWLPVAVEHDHCTDRPDILDPVAVPLYTTRLPLDR